MSVPKIAPEYVKQMQEALELPNDKHLYFNGYSIVVGATDISLVLRHNDKSIAILNTPHGVAKSLANALLVLLNDYEKRTGNPILTLDEIEKRITAYEPPK